MTIHPSVMGGGDPGPASEMAHAIAAEAVEAEILFLPPGHPDRAELEGYEARLKGLDVPPPAVRRIYALAQARATARHLGRADNPGRLA